VHPFLGAGAGGAGNRLAVPRSSEVVPCPRAYGSWKLLLAWWLRLIPPGDPFARSRCRKIPSSSAPCREAPARAPVPWHQRDVTARRPQARRPSPFPESKCSRRVPGGDGGARVGPPSPPSPRRLPGGSASPWPAAVPSEAADGRGLSPGARNNSRCCFPRNPKQKRRASEGGMVAGGLGRPPAAAGFLETGRIPAPARPLGRKMERGNSLGSCLETAAAIIRGS